MNNLGALYAVGDGVPKDLTEAARLYRAGADKGNRTAMFNLGMLYADGRGVPKDEAQALTWLRAAADKNLPAAMTVIGDFYQSGRGGLARDAAKAREWWTRAAEAGDPDAKARLK